ncbi:hypothetical protein B0O99DRAFT_594434 [Bisporella sp. PMI_857]|nr:hypothetical protein B0O99DRAFT_594434 [Bisporella sp. PMI_857]
MVSRDLKQRTFSDPDESRPPASSRRLARIKAPRSMRKSSNRAVSLLHNPSASIGGDQNETKNENNGTSDPLVPREVVTVKRETSENDNAQTVLQSIEAEEEMASGSLGKRKRSLIDSTADNGDNSDNDKAPEPKKSKGLASYSSEMAVRYKSQDKRGMKKWAQEDCLVERRNRVKVGMYNKARSSTQSDLVPIYVYHIIFGRNVKPAYQYAINKTGHPGLPRKTQRKLMAEIEPFIVFDDKYHVSGQRFPNHKDPLNKKFKVAYFRNETLAEEDWYRHLA